MARREKEQPELEHDWSPGVDDSLLIRSAESLGRVIGTLQRELDKATTKMFKANGAVPRNGKGPTARKRVKGVSKSAATRTAKAKTAKARKATAKKK